MVRIIIALFFCFPAVTFAQTYQQLSERAIECIEKDSLPQAEELLLQALKLEPKNAKNALLFSNLGLVQRRQSVMENFTICPRPRRVNVMSCRSCKDFRIANA